MTSGWTLHGLEGVRARLRAALATGRLHHALLLTGPRGSGKRTVARAVAMGLLCEAAPAPGGCGRCGACGRVVTGQHPDMGLVALPPGKTKIPVEDVRALLEELQRCPLEGRARVALVLDAEALGAEGQNSLLKTLEEPAPRTWLILTSTRPESLLATVRSRVDRLVLPPLPLEDLARLVATRHGADATAARRIALLAGGSLGMADELAAEGGQRARDLDRQCAALLEGTTSPVAAILGDVESEESVRQAKIDRARGVLAACLRQLHERGRDGDAAALQGEEAILSGLADLDLGLGAEVVLTSVHRVLAGARESRQPSQAPRTGDR